MLAPVDDARMKILERKVDALERQLQKRPTLEEISEYYKKEMEDLLSRFSS